MNHEDLCVRAMEWLRSRKRCQPVLAGIASCSEVPDAIGWTSNWRHPGSIVVECKTSVADFHRDRKKKFGQRMGDYRVFMSLPNVITRELLAKYCPDHGLIHVHGRITSIVVDPPRRVDVAHEVEIRYLRFAIIHMKDNLVRQGCTVNLTQLTKFIGGDGVQFPVARTDGHQ